MQNPRHNDYLDRGYRTGDLVERDGDGLLHFRGRVDFQIKHMGYRIELEEIEFNLNTIAGVRECGVVSPPARWRLRRNRGPCGGRARHGIRRVAGAGSPAAASPTWCPPHRAARSPARTRTARSTAPLVELTERSGAFEHDVDHPLLVFGRQVRIDRQADDLLRRTRCHRRLAAAADGRFAIHRGSR